MTQALYAHMNNNKKKEIAQRNPFVQLVYINKNRGKKRKRMKMI
jgi:hypothetical protein